MICLRTCQEPFHVSRFLENVSYGKLFMTSTQAYSLLFLLCCFVFFYFREPTLGKEGIQKQLVNMEQTVSQSNYHLMGELDNMMTGQFPTKTMTTCTKAKRFKKLRRFFQRCCIFCCCHCACNNA